MRFIRFYTMEPCILTTEEYERLSKEVRSRILAQDAGISDRILLKLLEEHEYNYNDAKRINGAKV